MPDIDNFRRRVGYMPDGQTGPAPQNPSLTEQAIQQALMMDPQSTVREGEFEAPPSPQGKLSPLSLAMLYGGAAADAGSTLHALSKGGSEANPLYGGNSNMALKLALAKGGSSIAAHLLMKKLAQSKPGLANALTKILGGVQMGVAAHNLGVAR